MTSAQGVINRLDPRTRVFIAFLFALAVVALHGVLPLLLALAGALLLLALAQLPWGEIWGRVAALEGFLLVLFLFLPFSLPGEPLFTLYGFTASQEGALRALTILLKVNAVALGLFALVGSLEPVLLGHALARLGVPEKLAHLLLFSLRYVAVLKEELERLRRAMRARAFVPAANRHTWRSLGWLAGMLLVRGVERSERILAAMKCRGFAGRFYLLDEGFAFHGVDAWFGALFVPYLATLLWLEFLT